MDNEKALIDNILKTNFEGIYEELKGKEYDDEAIFKILWELDFDSYRVNMYLFFLYLLSKNNNEAFWHSKCYMFLAYRSVLFNDGISLAAWHIRKAIELEPNNYEYQKDVLDFLYNYPDDYFTFDEYYKFALNVIKIDCKNANAIEILKKQNLKYD